MYMYFLTTFLPFCSVFFVTFNFFLYTCKKNGFILTVFQYASAFNGDLSKWKVDKFTDCYASTCKECSLFVSFFVYICDLILYFYYFDVTVFAGASAFNGDLSTWQTDKIFNMAYSKSKRMVNFLLYMCYYITCIRVQHVLYMYVNADDFDLFPVRVHVF